MQATAAVDVRKLVVEMDMSSVDRDIMSFLLSEGEGFDPVSGQVTGILSQMEETMEKDLADLTAKEEAAKVSFEETVVAKYKVIQANSEAIEAKTARHGEVISELDEVKALNVQFEPELEQHKADRTDAGAAIQEATGL